MCKNIISFSVIVPIFNRDRIIQNVINSVCSQDYSLWELILVDDGSTDNTKEICQRAADIESRIHYYYKENGGVSSARNYGLKVAKGDYVLFLDSDNSLRDSALTVLAEAIAKYKKTDVLCYGYTDGVNEWRPVEGKSSYLVEREVIRKKYLPTHINLLPQNSFFIKNYVWNKSYRTKFLRDNDILFDEKRCTWEDGIFVINCLDKTNQIGLLSDVIYNAYCDIEMDHLSSQLFETQLHQYLLDEAEFQRRFGEEFDFSNARYCRSNFNVIKMLFGRIVDKYGERSVSMIDEVIDMPILTYWIERVNPKDRDEKLIIKAVKEKKASRIYECYHASLFRKVINKLL